MKLRFSSKRKDGKLAHPDNMIPSALDYVNELQAGEAKSVGVQEQYMPILRQFDLSHESKTIVILQGGLAEIEEDLMKSVDAVILCDKLCQTKGLKKYLRCTGAQVIDWSEEFEKLSSTTCASSGDHTLSGRKRPNSSDSVIINKMHDLIQNSSVKREHDEFRVLAVCYLGLGASAVLLAALLMMFANLSAEDAVILVRQSRPGALTRSHLRSLTRLNVEILAPQPLPQSRHHPLRSLSRRLLLSGQG